MKTLLLWSLAVVIGAIAGVVLMLALKVGANTSCLDVIRQHAPRSCAVPTAAPWAVAVGALGGGVLAFVAAAASRRRR